MSVREAIKSGIINFPVCYNFPICVEAASVFAQKGDSCIRQIAELHLLNGEKGAFDFWPIQTYT